MKIKKGEIIIVYGNRKAKITEINNLIKFVIELSGYSITGSIPMDVLKELNVNID